MLVVICFDLGSLKLRTFSIVFQMIRAAKEMSDLDLQRVFLRLTTRRSSAGRAGVLQEARHGRAEVQADLQPIGDRFEFDLSRSPILTECSVYASNCIVFH